jgi:putative N-acetylmannosamine-6-phosphate epimerase/predicted NBD/HSP70 family sugar kinase
MYDEVPRFFRAVRGRVIVSCQAWPNDPFHAPQYMALFARAAVEGGAAAIRANGAEDVRAIRNSVSVPVIGIEKRTMPDGEILITRSLEDAARLVESGAAAVALDCTARGRRYGALERLRRIKSELRTPIAADIATVEEARAAAEAGADFVLSTMRGYTPETAHVHSFDSAFISELVRNVSCPVVAEGRIWTPEEARAALAAGAFAVVVGSAITRPRDITARFARAIETWNNAGNEWVAAIDLGGTNIKSGLVHCQGDLAAQSVAPASLSEGRAGLLDQLVAIGRTLINTARENDMPCAALGIAAAGWIEAESGCVVYATSNLPDWNGAPIAEMLSRALDLPVFVENDANAFAVAEKRFGSARNAANFVSITLGTGIGAGCFLRGELYRGSHSMANALGHLMVEPDGLPCTCGRRGCLEQYANATALLRYGGQHRSRSAAELIAAANGGDHDACLAIRTCAGYLARGCCALVDLFDPELIVLAGGLAQDNPLLLDALEYFMSQMAPLWKERRIALIKSPLGYFGGVLGAAAIAFDRWLSPY